MATLGEKTPLAIARHTASEGENKERKVDVTTPVTFYGGGGTLGK